MDNYFEGCPAKGMDSRHFTDYKTATRRNEHIKFINGNITRDDEFRVMLQQNGAEILRNTFNHHKENNACPVSTTCVHTYPTRMAPKNFADQMARYNAKASGQAVESKCQTFEDYTSSDY